MQTYFISIMINTMLLQYIVETETFPQLKIRSAKNLRKLVWKENKWLKSFRPSDLSWAIFQDIDSEIPIEHSRNWNQLYYERSSWD